MTGNPILVTTPEFYFLFEVKKHVILLSLSVKMVSAEEASHQIGPFTKRRVLAPLPDKEFDPTEIAVPWKILDSEGMKRIFTDLNAGLSE